MRPAMDEQRHRAAVWFRDLRDRITTAFEALAFGVILSWLFLLERRLRQGVARHPRPALSKFITSISVPHLGDSDARC